jgi:hypothetical protein
MHFSFESFAITSALAISIFYGHPPRHIL